MSRLGVVRWHATLDSLGGNSTSNFSNVGVFSLSAPEEWLQADVLLSMVVVTCLAVHLHCRRLTSDGASSVLALASLLVTLTLAPLVGSVLLICSCYRRLVSAVIRMRKGPRFAGLLHGTDAFWAMEEDESRSVINVLALADFSFIVDASPQEDEPLQTITELIQDRLLSSSQFKKLTCHRHHSRLGYIYWVKQDFIDISEHIRWMEIEDQGDQTITEFSLKNFVSSVTNEPLPSDHKAGWEILVGRYPIKPSSDLLDAMENGGWITKSCAGIRYPVLFRIHHSIGDGVALVNLLLDSLCDPSTRSNTPITNHRSSSPSFEKNFFRPTTPSIPEDVKESVIISSWKESDTPKYTQSSSCDFKSISLDIPTDSEVHKRKNFPRGPNERLANSHRRYSMDDFKYSVKSACQKVLGFIEETKDFKEKLNKSDIKDFDIVVNNRPSGEFLDMMKNATTLESKCVQSLQSKNENKNVKIITEKCTKWLSTLLSFLVKILKTLKSSSIQWSVFLFAPVTIFNQIIYPEDINLLHGPKLSGHKVVAWYLEQQDNPDQLLMQMIKRIRSKTGVRFSDVLLTAVSASLESFYAQCNEVPQFITVVIPSRVGLAGEAQASTKVIKMKNFSTKVTKIIDSTENNLENKFSVAMLNLPIATENVTKLKLFSKLRQVRKCCEVLRKSPDYLINFWMLRVLVTFVPTWFLRPLLRSRHSTLVLSNLPGPTRLTKLAGHTLHDLVFWVPNRTTTGVGVTALSYAGRLQLGLIADRALIACQQDAQLILDGIASAIQQMDQISSPT